MRNQPDLSETITLEKREVTTIYGEQKISAVVTRIFSHKGNPVGKLVQTTTCRDCYLEEMAAGDFLPVLVGGGYTHQYFSLLNNSGTETYWGQVSYQKARQISKRETTSIGRLRNKIDLAYLTFTFAN